MTKRRAMSIADETWMVAVMALDRSAHASAIAGDIGIARDKAAAKELLLDVANGWCGRTSKAA